MANTASLLLLLLGLLLAPILAHQIYNSKKQDSREPPYIQPKVPFIGHVLGMLNYGAKYLDMVK